MNVQMCYPVRNKCWNPEDSYGEICVGCGCCSSDARERAIARYRVSVVHMEEKKAFKDWDDDPKWRDIQKKNVKSDIRWYKRRIRYYRMRLKKLGVNEG